MYAKAPSPCCCCRATDGGKARAKEKKIKKEVY